eukprot:scaffold347917_cov51-Attheya_sp.AAC.1
MGRIGWHQYWNLLTSNDWLWWGVMAAAAVGSSVGVAYYSPFHNTNATNTTNNNATTNKEENDTTGKEDTVGLSSFGVVSAWERRIIHPKRRDWVASWMAIRQSSLLHEEYARMLPLLVAWWCGTQTQPHYPTSHHHGNMGWLFIFVPSTVLFATWLVSPTNETTNTDTTTTTIDHDPNNATTPKHEEETEVPMKVQEEEEEECSPPSTSTSVKEDPIGMTRNDLKSSSLHNNNKEQENGRYLELL